MTPIIPQLKSGDRGGAVGNLQEALLLLIEKGLIQPSPDELSQLIAALRSERQGRAYGTATVSAVTLFQVKHHLQATGAVDTATAEANNGLLKELGAIHRDPDAVVFVVDGTVASRERAGVG